MATIGALHRIDERERRRLPPVAGGAADAGDDVESMSVAGEDESRSVALTVRLDRPDRQLIGPGPMLVSLILLHQSVHAGCAYFSEITN